MHMNDSQYKLKWDQCPHCDEVHVLECCHPYDGYALYQIKPLNDTASDWQSILHNIETGRETIIWNGDLIDCMLKCQEDAYWEFGKVALLSFNTMDDIGKKWKNE